VDEKLSPHASSPPVALQCFASQFWCAFMLFLLDLTDADVVDNSVEAAEPVHLLGDAAAPATLERSPITTDPAYGSASRVPSARD